MPTKKSKTGLAAYNRLHKKDIAKRNREDKKALAYLKPKKGRGRK